MTKALIAGSGKVLRANGTTTALGSTAVPSGGVGNLTTSMALTDMQTSWPVANPVIQRKAGTTYADVPVMFTYTGSAPASVEARVIKAADGRAVKGWTALTNFTASGGSGSGTLPNVKQGAWYYLQIRCAAYPNDIACRSNGTTQWGVGIVVLFMGQSNMVGTFSGGSYADIVPGSSLNEIDYYEAGRVFGAVFDDAGWRGPSNGTVALYGPASTISGNGGIGTISGGLLKTLRIVSKALEAKYGDQVPIGIVPWAFGSKSLQEFYRSGDVFSILYNKSGTTVGNIGFQSPKNFFAGDIEGLMWHQGEGNSADDRATYYGKLKLLYQDLLTYVSSYGRTAADFFFCPAVIGNYDPTSLPNAEKTRSAFFDLETYAATNNWPKVRIGWTTIDLKRRYQSGNSGPLDGLHFDDSTGCQTRSQRRMIQTVLYQLGCATFSGRGPQINMAGITRNGLVVTIPITHEGGTALQVPNSGTAITGWYANTAADFSGTDIAVTAAIADASHVTVTFPGGTIFPAYLKHLGGKIGSTVVDGGGYTASCYPNISNIVYDNSVYPRDAANTIAASEQESLGLPLLPTADAILIN